jgi:nitrogen regulatory protein PII-like uncharacterized protein
MKLESFNFFRFRHSFRGLTPLKLKNFVQKLKIYPIPKKISQCSSWESWINISRHHTKKLENFNFFRFRHSFRGLTPLKLKNFVQKLKISPIPQSYSRCSFWECWINISNHHTMKLENFNFFGFRDSFRGLIPLKLKNFVQKLKIYPVSQNISQRSSWESCIIASVHHTLEFDNFNFYWVSSLISWANTF